ncbi:hypothetical protein ABI_20570 [Asticcacaulis biprosthecium C19]|uniref:Uncharacterized protein n=1 Tax=Asticcacaulis biprosthecium C19 TaxID=715226 RepID=F4QM44_9CAUL|nr:hypothetical protein ABI_20570 [Asticcacaulis biprosthecium C19]
MFDFVVIALTKRMGSIHMFDEILAATRRQTPRLKPMK